MNATANNPGSYNETLIINGYYQNATSILFKTMSTTLTPGKVGFIQMSWNPASCPCQVLPGVRVVDIVLNRIAGPRSDSNH